jgi:hypothetical protein
MCPNKTFGRNYLKPLDIEQLLYKKGALVGIYKISLTERGCYGE